MTYFYTEFSIKEGQMQEQGTKLFLYQEVGPFISSDFHLEQYPQTAPVPCIYTILESENIYPDEETACQMSAGERNREQSQQEFCIPII